MVRGPLSHALLSVSQPCSGSLIARILFQPVEEMSRVFFSRTLGNVAQKEPINKDSKTDADKGALRLSADTLTSILSAQIGASVILCTFGPPLLPLALQIVLPSRYLATSAPQLLQAWIWYIPILAINGVLEAFIASVASTQDIHRQSRYVQPGN
jgi:oligosaccharide translocation protein RFT1